MFDFARVMFAGDTHGDTSNIVNFLIPLAKRSECPVIFVLGDFGFWSHQQSGIKFLFDVNKYLVRNDMWLFWLDGNHENHHLLNLLMEDEKNKTDDGFFHCAERILYSPRGHHFHWGDTDFMSFGGAYSIDRANRVLYRSWWENEIIDFSDYKKAISVDKNVDILLSHDTLNETTFEKINLDKMEPNTDANRKFVSAVADHFRVKRNIHGHYHVQEEKIIETSYGECLVNSLDCNIRPWLQTLIVETKGD